MQWFTNDEIASNMNPYGNVLRVFSVRRCNAADIVCEGKTEHGLMFAARGKLEVLGINNHFIIFCDTFSYNLQEYHIGMHVSCTSVLFRCKELQKAAEFF